MIVCIWVRKHQRKKKKGLWRNGKLLEEKFIVFHHNDWRAEAEQLIPDWTEVEILRLP